MSITPLFDGDRGGFENEGLKIWIHLITLYFCDIYDMRQWGFGLIKECHGLITTRPSLFSRTND